MPSLSVIDWTWDPIAFSFWKLTIRWYGLCFLAGILTSIWIMEPLFGRLKRDREEATSLTLYVTIGIVLGARIAHVCFYDPSYYFADPVRILKIWEGGLASHGAAVGALLASWIWVRGYVPKLSDRLAPKTPAPIRLLLRILFGTPTYTPGLSWRQMVDIAAPAIALAGAFIRLGNLFNHEIVGRTAGNLPWAFRFSRHRDQLPRHPTQIYEIFMFLFIFAVLYHFAWKRDEEHRPGFRAYLFFTLWFGIRFFIEFSKEYQSELAQPFGLSLTMGQMLSAPFVMFFAPLTIWAWRRPTEGSTPSEQDPAPIEDLESKAKES